MSMVARTQDATIASVERGSTVADAVRSMREQRVGSFLIPTAGQTLSESLHSFGIFTEKDYLKLLAKSAADGNDYRQTLVAEVMTPAESMIWVEPNLPAIDALHLMATKGMRHLPVRKPYDWLYRPGMPLKKGFILAPEAPALLAVVSMRSWSRMCSRSIEREFGVFCWRCASICVCGHECLAMRICLTGRSQSGLPHRAIHYPPSPDISGAAVIGMPQGSMPFSPCSVSANTRRSSRFSSSCAPPRCLSVGA